jgi:hypothetical protein
VLAGVQGSDRSRETSEELMTYPDLMICPVDGLPVVGSAALRGGSLHFLDDPNQPFALAHAGHTPAGSLGSVALLDLWRDGARNVINSLSGQPWWDEAMAEGVTLSALIPLEYPEPTPRTPAQRRGWRTPR